MPEANYSSPRGRWWVGYVLEHPENTVCYALTHHAYIPAIASLKFEGLSRNIQTTSLPDLLTCASAPAPVRPLSFERGPQRTDVRRALGLSLPALSGHNLTRSYSTCTYTYMHKA